MNRSLSDLGPPSKPHYSEAAGVPAPMSQWARRAAGTSAGAAIGSALGIFAGPMGIVAGAVVGAALSMISELTAERASVVAEERDKELDATIGVSGGEMGAPPWSKELPLSFSEDVLDDVVAAVASEREIFFASESLRPISLAA